ncbi:biotin--[acetyl-CoA-carboxylase] ligase [Chloroflexota bacterium]
MEESLSPASITDKLETRLIGQKIIYYPRLSSTMDVAKRAAQQGATEGTVVIADEQTAGKGRIKRVWFSPRGSISLSVVLKPSVSYLPYLTMLASLAVVHSIETVAGLKPQIKWPNDVLIDGKKVCGILAESEMRENAVAYAIIGIGINVNLGISGFPEIPSTATSLADELGNNVSRLDLIRCLLGEIDKLYLALPGSTGILYEEWRDRLMTLDKKVRVQSGESTLEGIAESVYRDGSLLLRHPDGSSTRIVAGDITLRDYQ